MNLDYYIFNVKNSNLNFIYNSNNIITYTFNSNNINSYLYGNFYANNYYFNSNKCSLITNSNNIIYNAKNHYFNGDLNVNGIITGQFPTNIIKLNSLDT